MPSSNRSRQKAPRISINGVFLDAVYIRMEPGRFKGAVSQRGFPAAHHRVSADGETVVLRTPATVALQLYYDGVLPVNREQAVELKVGRKKAGRFLIKSLHCPEGYEFGEPVLIRFTPIDKDRQPTT